MPKPSIYRVVNSLYRRLLREEAINQGHDLTGEMIDSVKVTTTKFGNNYRYEVFIADYARYVNYGIRPENVSWKMYPGLIHYFKLRGFAEASAKKFAAMTIQKWLVEGMPTGFSSVYSKTGERTNFIELAFINRDEEANRELERAFEIEVDIIFKSKLKSETI